MRLQSGPPDEVQLEQHRHHERLAAVVVNAEDVGLFTEEIGSEELAVEDATQAVDAHVRYRLTGSRRRVQVHTYEAPPDDWMSEASFALWSEAGYSHLDSEDFEPTIARFAREISVDGHLELQVPDGATKRVFLARENAFAVVTSSGRTATVLGPEATLNRCQIDWRVPTFD